MIKRKRRKIFLVGMSLSTSTVMGRNPNSHVFRDHPFRTSTIWRGKGSNYTVVKNCRQRGVEVKNCVTFADVLNEWSLTQFAYTPWTAEA